MTTDDQNENESVTAEEVAKNILAWAKKYNLFSKVPVEDAVDDESIDRSMLPQQMFSTHGVEDILRKRSINLVAFNEKDRKVTIFTNGRITKSETKFLPFHFSRGIEIDYVTGGVATVKGSSPNAEVPLPYWTHGDKVCCGSSIHPVSCFGAGTMGALIRSKAGVLYGLTNNHVSGACNLAAPGLPILCPGPLDATEDRIAPFTIGRHTRLCPINDGIPENIDVSANCDAAIFKIEDEVRVSSMQGGRYDTPASVIPAEPGMRVEKVGRTTGPTAGRIIGVSASPLPVGYSLPEYGVRKNVFFQNVLMVQGDNDQAFSKPGDSGSLVVGYDGDGNRHAVGIVFAGNEKHGLSFILSLPEIVLHFDADIVHGHNVP